MDKMYPEGFRARRGGVDVSGRALPRPSRCPGYETGRTLTRYVVMAGYTFYVLESDGYLVGGTTLDCPDDTLALRTAEALLGTFSATVEVWQGSRKVGHVGASIEAHAAQSI